jgi:UDP-N-acetyl-D-mannosaminuronate dehydrogenase
LRVAVAFGRSGVQVIGFHVDCRRMDELHAGRDRTREVEADDLKHASLRFDDPACLAAADFYIVTVPTPVESARRSNPNAITFKEKLPDIRNSKVIDIARELGRVGVTVQVHDPLALPGETAHEYDIDLTPFGKLTQADADVFAVAHSDYVAQGWPLFTKPLKHGRGTVLDVKSKLDRAQKPEGVDLWRL